MFRTFILPGVKYYVRSIHKQYDGCDRILRNHRIGPQPMTNECTIIVSPFIIIKRAHFRCKQSFASWCLQIEHIQPSLIIISTFFVVSTLHQHISTMQLTVNKFLRKTIIVLMGICKTNNEISKHNVSIPRNKSQRIPIFIFSPEE